MIEMNRISMCNTKSKEKKRKEMVSYFNQMHIFYNDVTYLDYLPSSLII